MDRTREAEYRAQLYASRMEPAGMAIAGLCKIELERAMSKLIDATADEVPALQGEARIARRILKYLTARSSVAEPKV